MGMLGIRGKRYQLHKINNKTESDRTRINLNHELRKSALPLQKRQNPATSAGRTLPVAGEFFPFGFQTARQDFVPANRIAKYSGRLYLFPPTTVHLRLSVYQ